MGFIPASTAGNAVVLKRIDYETLSMIPTKLLAGINPAATSIKSRNGVFSSIFYR